MVSHIGTTKQWTQKFNYDSVGRLSEASEYRGDNNALSYKQTFDYDRFGNLYRKADSNPAAGQQNPLSYNPIEDGDINKNKNRFTSNTAYDEAGNVIQDTKFRSMNYSYDANGRMFKTSNTDNTNQASSVYDAAGQRVATQVQGVWTYFIYDAFGKMVAEYSDSSSTNNGGVKYVMQDWQGSTRAVVSNTGSVQSRMDYTAFGEEINAGVGQRTTAQGFGANNNLSQKYALTERDKATGLDHTWFRKNENRAGRWTSPDPYNGSMSLGNPQSFNRYSYVENQPTNFVDPSGLDDEDTGPPIRIETRIPGNWYDALLSLYLGGLGRQLTMPVTFGDPFTGGGVGGGGGSEGQQSKESNGCKKHREKLLDYIFYLNGLWKETGSGTNNKVEKGGLIGVVTTGEIIAGRGEPLKISTYTGISYENRIPYFSVWAGNEINTSKNTAEYLYFVHTHPGGTTNPSGGKFGERTGDRDVASFLGLPGVIVTANKISVFNETGKLCEFNRTSNSITPL